MQMYTVCLCLLCTGQQTRLQQAVLEIVCIHVCTCVSVWVWVGAVCVCASYLQASKLGCNGWPHRLGILSSEPFCQFQSLAGVPDQSPV